jgi:amino acid transporter
MRRDISPTGLLFVAIGAIIGSGWLLSALPAARMAGPSATVAWIIGGVMIGLVALVYAELGTMFPISGGVVRFPHFTHGVLTSYGVGWISWLVAVSLGPVEVEAVLQYATNYLPFLTHTSGGIPVLTGAGYGVAVGLLLVFTIINIFGVRIFSRVNVVVVWWKIAVVVLLIVAFLAVAFHPAHFSEFGGFMPYGSHGIFSAIATAGIAYSYFGFRQGIEMAGEAKKPQRAVPLTVLGSLAVTVVLYVLVQVAFLGAVPTGSVAQGGWASLNFSNAFGPLAGIAQIIGLFWLAGILYADAFVSPADTGLIYTTVTSRISYAMGRSATAPRALSRVSRRGVPWVSVLLTFGVGLLIFLPFPGWQKLAAFLTAANALSFGSGPVALLVLRRTLPDQPRRFRLPAAPVFAFLAFYATGLLVYWVGWNTDWKMFVALAIGYGLFVVYRVTQPRPRPALRWRQFAWMAGWFVGLLVISALGSFGGGAGVISFVVSIPLIAVFSVLVLWWGVATGLRAPEVREQLAAYGDDGTDAAQSHRE